MSEPKRQLAAIMFTDIVGYTKLMGENEEKAIQTLEKSTSIQKEIIEKHNGKVIKEIGDGLLASFSSAVDAVNSAIEIQKAVENDENVNLKIGIHLGDVVFKDGDVLGDGVNVASRIESIGKTGSVLVSEKVKDEIINHGFGTISIGKYDLKNSGIVEIYALTEEPLIIPKISEIEGKVLKVSTSWSRKIPAWVIFLFAFIALTSVAWFFSTNRTNLSHKENPYIRIAILPFSYNGSNEFTYLEGGMMDLLSSKIYGIGDLIPVDPNIIYNLFEKYGKSVANLLDSKSFLDLNSNYILHGSIIESDGSFIVIANLISPNGKLIEKIEFRATNLDLLYNSSDKLLIDVISKITPQNDLSGEGIKSAKNLEAVNLFLMGENARRNGQLDSANVIYRRALEKDSTFALAWVRWWINSQWIAQGNRYWKERQNAAVILKDLKTELSPQLRSYVEAHLLLSKGKIIKAKRLLEYNLASYGLNSSVLYLLIEIKIHFGWYLETSILNSEKDIYSLINLDPNFEAYSHLYDIALKKRNFTLLDSILRNSLAGPDNFGIFRKTLKYAKYISDEEIDNFPVDSAIADTTYLNTLFLQLGRLDLFVNLFVKNKDKFKNGDYHLFLHSWTDRLRGKYEEAFEYTRWGPYLLKISRAAQITNPLNDSLYHYFVTFMESPENIEEWNRRSFGIAARAFFRLSSTKPTDIGYLKDNLEDKLKEVNERISSSDSADYTDLTFASWATSEIRSIQIAEFMKNGDLENAYLTLDTVLNNLVYWTNYYNIGTYFIHFKIIQAQILFNQNKWNESLEKIKYILEYLDILTQPDLIGATYFLLASNYDKLNNFDEALKYYQHFYTIYKDCDPFYQHNVEHSKQRIEELEAQLIQPR